MRIDLDGRLAIVAGAGSPVAAAVAQALADNGATVVRAEASDAATLDMLVARHGEPFLLVQASAGAAGLPERDTAGNAGELAAFAAAARHLAPRLKRVVHLVSAAGLVPVRGLAAFSAAQAGLVSLTRTLAMELGPEVRVNAVAVGAHSDGGTATGDRMIGHTALGRPARLGEIAAAALFLADPDNGYMTGHTLGVDGGWVAGYARNF